MEKRMNFAETMKWIKKVELPIAKLYLVMKKLTKQNCLGNNQNGFSNKDFIRGD